MRRKFLKGRHLHPTNIKVHEGDRLGARAADWMAEHIGSWTFVIVQAIISVIWIVINTLVIFKAIQFDPYPYILFNLAMSGEAALTAPIIMMSQNRQTEHDRHRAEIDYYTNMETLRLLQVVAKDVGVPQEKIAEISAAFAAQQEKVR